MKPSRSNAFLDPGRNSFSNPRGTLANMLAAMQAESSQRNGLTTLSLTPMRFMDAIRQWQLIHPYDRVMNLLIDPSSSAAETLGMPGPCEIIRRSFRIAGESFGDDMLVVNDETLQQVAELPLDRFPRVVRILGPVEASDAQALRDAMKRGSSLLEAEVRSVAALAMSSPRCIRLEVREPEHAMIMVAESFRHYIAALRKCPVNDISAPATWQVERLLGVAGAISIRPIETELFSTSIDVGICAQAGGPTKPANCSLIYDIFSDSWHDEY